MISEIVGVNERVLRIMPLKNGKEVSLLSWISWIPHSTNNFQNLLPTVRVTPLNLFSASTVNLHGASNSIRIPHSNNNFQKLLPTVRVTPLNLFSASTVNLHGASNSSMFRNNLQVRLSPLKSPILRKYINPFNRPGMYPSISKCNAKKSFML